jgi:hypothetical protein
MIWVGVRNVFTAFLDLVLRPLVDMIPSPPPYMQQGFDALGVVWGYLGALDAWLPIGTAFVCLQFVFAVRLIALSVQLTRTILSYLTFGGGAS